MKIIALIFVAALSIASYADSPATAKRDKALERINACLKRNEASSLQCKDLSQNIQTLVDVYKAGDRTVLPTLFRFTYLTDFFDEALLSDPDAFLSALSQLPENNQKAVANGMAGGIKFGDRSTERFEALRASLTGISDSSPFKQAANLCLRALEANNAARLVTYFPPDTFKGRGADFQVQWYSSELYAFKEKPLWPPSPDNENTYRFTHIGAWKGTAVVTLAVQPDSTGRIVLKKFADDPASTWIEKTAALSRDQVTRFLTQLEQAHYWEMPAQIEDRGFDGAEWILEGVQNSKYHLATRWCPGTYQKTPNEVAFAQAMRTLFELAGEMLSGC